MNGTGGYRHNSGPADLIIALTVILILAAVAIPCFKKARHQQFELREKQKMAVRLHANMGR